MRSWILLAALMFTLLLSSCRQEEINAPTAAPAATLPPIPTPTSTPVIPNVTPTPGYLEPRYHENGIAALEPSVSVVNSSKGAVNSQNPSFMDLEINTLYPLTLTLKISRIEEDGRLFLVEYKPVVGLGSQEADSSVVQPGVHEQLLTWDAQGSYLTDGEAGEFIFLEDIGSARSRVRGEFTPAGSDQAIPVYLEFDKGTGILTSVVDAESGEAITFSTGDVVQPERNYLEGVEGYLSEPGADLTINDYGQLYLQRIPLPDGRYQLDYRFENPEMKPFHLFEQMKVENSESSSGEEVYFDPVRGLQFLVPLGWAEPENRSGRLVTYSPDGALTLTVASQPADPDLTSGDLRDGVMELFGEINLLYEEPVTIGDVNTTWAAYGYESEEIPVTGVFLALVDDGWGYIFDLEAKEIDDEWLLDTADSIFDSIQIRAVGRDEHPGDWEDTQVGDYIFSADRSLLWSKTSLGWDRFAAKDGDSFIAFRQLDSQDAGAFDLREYLLAELVDHDSEAALSEQYRLSIGVNDWNRIDYDAANPGETPRVGFLMRLAESAADLLVWGESSADKIDSLERETFNPMIADVRYAVLP